MHSRERLKTALDHRVPDRVPMMMSANPWVIEKLKKRLQVNTDRELLQAMHLDLFDMRGFDYKGAVGPRYVGPGHMNIPATWCGDPLPLFGYHEVITETPFGKAWSMGAPPLAALNTIEALKHYPWPQADWFDYANVRRDLEPWAADFAIALTGPSIFQHATLCRGVGQLLLDMAADPDLTTFILDRFFDFYFEYTRRILEAAGGLIDIVRLADDIGAENALLVSPRMISRYFGHRISSFADLAHQHNAKLLFHTDGNVRQIIPDLIAWGVDILDPVQPEVAAMNHRALKTEYGDRLSFSGGVSAQRILPTGSVDDVKAEARRVIAELGAGGGYILSPGHPSFQSDVPIDNILAMYSVGLE